MRRFVLDDKGEPALPAGREARDDRTARLAGVAVPHHVRNHFLEAQIHRELRIAGNCVPGSEALDPLWNPGQLGERALQIEPLQGRVGSVSGHEARLFLAEIGSARGRLTYIQTIVMQQRQFGFPMTPAISAAP